MLLAKLFFQPEMTTTKMILRIVICFGIFRIQLNKGHDGCLIKEWLHCTYSGYIWQSIPIAGQNWYGKQKICQIMQ